MRVPQCITFVALLAAFDSLEAADVFRAGASAIDITPRTLPVRQNGGFLERTVETVADPLHARALVLDDGSTRLGIVVVDSCMLTRELCDEVKAAASPRAQIAPERLLIAATHTHSAPGVMDFCLGSRADPAYREALPPLLVEAIETAATNLRPAQIGWAVAWAPEHTNCRRWITRPDRMQDDPFGERTVRAMMHPGYQNPDFIGPSGPIDPGLSLLSVRSPDGAPIGLLANYSMHYFGVGGGLSADYCGRFAQKIASKITAGAPGAGSPAFVGAMSQGTSGDLHWMDYGAPQRAVTIDAYTDGLVEIALEAYRGIRYHRWVSLAMAEKRLTLDRRVPDEKRLEWARRTRPDSSARPRSRPEVYAEQAIYLRENPNVEIVLQAARIGELGITAIPCEVYGITGLELKARSPLPATFNMELANGAAGYIPPPEQHALGGYTTWPARTAGLEVEAAPKIVAAVLELLEIVSGRARRAPREGRGTYPATILRAEPWAYLRLGEFGGSIADDASGHGRSGRYEGGVARYLPGPESAAFSGEDTNRAVHLAGGWIRLPDAGGPGRDYSIELWFWNGLPADARDTAGYLFSYAGDRLAISGTEGGKPGRLVLGELVGETAIPVRTWHHAVFTRSGESVYVWLNGRSEPEIQGEVPLRPVEAGGATDILIGADAQRTATFEGKIDEVAVYDRALGALEVALHYRDAGVGASPASTLGRSGLEPLLEPLPPGMESLPLSPAESMKVTHVRPGFVLELVAAEPLVVDPVAIDWGPDGKLWVAEMADYPLGMDGEGEPGGRIRFLEDTDGDARYDRSVVFLDGVRFPTGVMPWRDGVLVTAAPDIFYAEDTDGDGRADRREVLFTGFLPGNQQLRVNGLRYGLDNWVYCASGGHHAGYGTRNTVKSLQTGVEIPLGSRDLRMRPDEGRLDPEAGPSQFGRVRDDWGNWFGVQNSFPIWHYVLRDRQVRRNPYVAAPDPRQQLFPPNPQVYPAKAPQKRFHSFEESGRFTSACGPSIYRDDLLFFRGSEPNEQHAFACEPFHNVVQHIILRDAGVSFGAWRSAAEGERDFFASADRWCRPVMTRTGPDGALWVVDMYRYMIEHPEWLPEAGKEELRPFYRSGDDRGRIYRIYPEGRQPRALASLARLDAAGLVEQLESPNGPVRDTAQRLLVQRGDREVIPPLERMAIESASPLARVHALWTLDGMGTLNAELIALALRDGHPGVVRSALRVAESRGDAEPDIIAAAAKLIRAQDMKVRLELAASLGAWTHPKAGETLADMAVLDYRDRWMRAAILGSTVTHYRAVAEAVAEAAAGEGGDVLEAMFEPLAHQGVKSERYDALAALLTPVAMADRDDLTAWHYGILGRFLVVLAQNQTSLEKLSGSGGSVLRSRLERVRAAIEMARAVALDTRRPDAERIAAVGLLGRVASEGERDLALLGELISPRSPSSVQIAAVRALGRSRADAAAILLFAGWPSYMPAVRAVAVEQFLQSAEWSALLLLAVQSGDVAPATLGVTERQRLLHHGSKSVAELARGVLRIEIEADRSAVLERFRPALQLVGDKARGEVIFQTTCGTCHSFDDRSRLIGPDLRSITDRSGEGLLASIIDPSGKVDPQYLGYNAILSDGEILFGVISGETGNSIIFHLVDGARRTVLRSRIEHLESTGLSFMPTGLESELTVEGMADLIEYLKRL